MNAAPNMWIVRLTPIKRIIGNATKLLMKPPTFGTETTNDASANVNGRARNSPF